MKDTLEKFYEQEKSKLERYIDYNQNRNKSLYTNEELEKFNDYVRHSSDWLRKIKQLIDGDYIFDDVNFPPHFISNPLITNLN